MDLLLPSAAVKPKQTDTSMFYAQVAVQQVVLQLQSVAQLYSTTPRVDVAAALRACVRPLYEAVGLGHLIPKAEAQ